MPEEAHNVESNNFLSKQRTIGEFWLMTYYGTYEA